MVKKYVDENGEVFIMAPARTHKVVGNQQAETHRRRKEFTGRQADFTASNMRNLHEVYDTLTTAQCGYLMLLQCYVSYDGGTLVNSGHGRSYMTKPDMMSVLQLEKKRSTFYDFFNACITADIIRKSGDGKYAVNPRYHFRGNFNDQYVVKSYTSKIKQVYREVKAADIGLIYRMLPYVHMNTNALCANPFEQDPKQIDWFNLRELAEAIGVNPDTLGKRLPRMTFDGKYVVARIKVGKEPVRFAFNPNVFYRKGEEPDDTLKGMFNVRKSK
jgi:hypothetical protein